MSPLPSLDSLSRLLGIALVGTALLAGVCAWLFLGSPAGGESGRGVLLAYLALGLAMAGSGLLFAIITLRRLGGELATLTTMLREISNAPQAVNTPTCRFEDTGVLAMAVTQVADVLRYKNRALTEVFESDPVTGAWNRAQFFQQMRHAHELARRGNEVCLMLAEIEGLGRTTDALGHEAADALLKMLTDTLRAYTRKSDVVARLGVHDFGVLYYNVEAHLMRPRLERLVGAFRAAQETSLLTANRVFCSITLGFTAVDPKSDRSMEDVFQRAQHALRTARGAESDDLRIQMALPAARPDQ